MVEINKYENISTLPKRPNQVVKSPVSFRNIATPVATGDISSSFKAPLWKKTKLWIAIFAILVLAIIGYGIWLPHAIMPSL